MADDVTSLRLTFNVTMDKDGTKICCSSLHTHSNIAVLLSINGKLRHSMYIDNSQCIIVLMVCTQNVH